MSPARMCSGATSTASWYAARRPSWTRTAGSSSSRSAGGGRRHVRQRAGQVVDQPGQAVHRGVVGARRASALGVEEHVLDQVEALAEVVERGDVPGEGQDRVGEAEVVGGDVGQPLDLAHHVVAEVADDPAVERRQVVEARAPGTRRGAPRARRAPPGRAARRAAAGRRRPAPSTRGPPASARGRARGTRTGPSVRACSTDSSRNPVGPSGAGPTSFTNADTGVSRSASTSRQTGTTV